MYCTVRALIDNRYFIRLVKNDFTFTENFCPNFGIESDRIVGTNGMQYSRIEYFAKCRKVEYESTSWEHKVSSEQWS